MFSVNNYSQTDSVVRLKEVSYDKLIFYYKCTPLLLPELIEGDFPLLLWD